MSDAMAEATGPTPGPGPEGGTDGGSAQPEAMPMAGAGEPTVGAAAGAGPAGTSEVPVTIELLHDVELKVEVVLGRARLPLRDLLALRPGSTIELDRTRNSPVDVLVNGTLFARGDIVVIDDAELGVQIDTVVGTEGARQGRPA